MEGRRGAGIVPWSVEGKKGVWGGVGVWRIGGVWGGVGVPTINTLA